MAIIVVGGLIVSTLLNLVALPALYLRYGASREVDLGLQPADLPAAAAD
jgi:Cu/Ag efflux pump CusA